MSRTGKKPIPIPGGVTVDLEGDVLRVKGPKGELHRQIHPKVTVNIENDRVLISIQEQDKETRALHGLSRALIAKLSTTCSIWPGSARTRAFSVPVITETEMCSPTQRAGWPGCGTTRRSSYGFCQTNRRMTMNGRRDRTRTS